MKNIKLSLLSLVALGSFSYAGGDLTVVTPYEVEDAVLAEEAYVEPVVEPTPEPVVIPVVAPKPIKHIKANGFYVGLGISGTRYETNCKTGCSQSGTDHAAGVMARVGYDFNKYIGIEARGITSNWNGDGGTVEHAGLFVKPMLPVGDATNIYGLVGVAKTKTKGGLQRTNAESLALGAGIEVDVSKDIPKDGRYGRPFDGKGDQEKGLGVFLDYERMVVKSDAPNLDAVSAGVTYDF
jgi:OOP family OmpA-OmpF porin